MRDKRKNEDKKLISIMLSTALAFSAAACSTAGDPHTSDTVDARFTDGWGDYLETEPVVSFEESGKHTVEIVSRDEEGATTIYIGGLFVS